VFAIATSAKAQVRELPSVPAGVRRVLRLAGFACLAVAVGASAAAFVRPGHTAHEFPVVAVAFARDQAGLVSVDAQGVVVDWDVRSKREIGRVTIPELAGTTEAFDVYGVGYAIANGRALRFTRVGGAPVRTIPDARHLARGPALVIARERALVFVSYFNDWTKPPDQEMAWPETITAVAGRDEQVAVADRVSVSLLDGRPGSARTLASVPAPGAITRLALLSDWKALALDASGRGWFIHFYRRVTEPLGVNVSLVAAAAHGLFVSGREIARFDELMKKSTPVGTLGSGALSMDTWDKYVALGFERGDVALGTFDGAKLETVRLTAADD
jgi:hypothetical protein